MIDHPMRSFLSLTRTILLVPDPDKCPPNSPKFFVPAIGPVTVIPDVVTEARKQLESNVSLCTFCSELFKLLHLYLVTQDWNPSRAWYSNGGSVR